MDTISFRVPTKLKEDMKKVGVNWSQEVRQFIERRVRQSKKEEAIKKIDSVLSRMPGAEKGTASHYVREDRDRH